MAEEHEERAPQSGHLKAGKVPAALLERLLARIPRTDRRVVLWPAVGEDAAAIAFGEKLLIAKTDPITFAADLIGWYAVHVNANDIATCGAIPRWFMATVLLPEGATADMAQAIFDQIVDACDGADIAVVGGHSEVTPQVARPVVVGCMLGEVERDGLVRTGGARPGDALVLTKGVAVEGTAVLAREAADELRARGVPQDELRAARQFLFSPGISVVREAAILAGGGGASAMHDPTEGGLATGLAEMAVAGGHGLRVNEDAILILPECRAICGALELDPLGLIASGSLLAAVPPARAYRAVGELEQAGIAAAVIGEVRPREDGLVMDSARGARPLPQFERDELARYFGAGDA
ncbi:MAG: AIR synthase family protein [Armatimonadota bacterium]|nr:MAG: AIR synthase family protein [Armatimonadota bacterium]